MTGFVPLESLTGLFLFITLVCAYSPNVWNISRNLALSPRAVGRAFLRIRSTIPNYWIYTECFCL